MSRRACQIAYCLVLILTSQSTAAALQMQLIGSHAVGNSWDWGIVNFDVNPVTGRSHPIDTNPERGYLFSDMDFGPDGKLYARDSGRLGTVDIASGEFSPIGNGLGIIPDPVAFSPGGELYTLQWDTNVRSDKLYRVNPTTGELNLIGTVGAESWGMDFGPDGKLYASDFDEIYTINVQTGHKDRVVYPALPTFRGLDFGADGVLRGVTDEELFEIDIERQMIKSLGRTTKTEMRGLASIHRSGPGDFVPDGVVDGDDFAAWRNSFGAFEESIAHAGNADGIVNAADYTVWRDRLAVPNSNATIVPEPTAQMLALALVVWAFYSRW